MAIRGAVWGTPGHYHRVGNQSPPCASNLVAPRPFPSPEGHHCIAHPPPQVLAFLGRPLVIEPSSGQLSGDTGRLSIRQFDDRAGITRGFTEALDDPATPACARSRTRATPQLRLSSRGPLRRRPACSGVPPHAESREPRSSGPCRSRRPRPRRRRRGWVEVRRARPARVLRATPPRAFQRVGSTTGAGELTVDQLLTSAINHIPHRQVFLSAGARARLAPAAAPPPSRHCPGWLPHGEK